MSEYRGKTDRQRVIEWMKEDLERYKTMIGEITEYKVTVTQSLIDTLEERIELLKERERDWNDTRRRLCQQS